MQEEYENELNEAKGDYVFLRQEILEVYRNIPEKWKIETVNALTATEGELLKKGILPENKRYWEEKMATLTSRLDELRAEGQSQTI